MKVILLKNVPKVGKKDEIVEVSEGYANNALFPKKMAILATANAISALEKRKTSHIEEISMKHALLDKAISELNGMQVSMKVKANEQGNLFSKIHDTDIAKYLVDAHRIAIDPKTILLPEGSIKKIGTYVLNIKDGQYQSQLTIDIIKE